MRRGPLVRGRAGALGLLLLVGAAPAAAHRLAPSLLELREGSAGGVEVRWKTSLYQTPRAELRPELPPHCRPLASPVGERSGTSATLRWTVDCGAEGLVGHSVRVRGLAESGIDALLRIALSDGRRVRAVLSADRSVFTIPERERPLRVARDTFVLGAEHIATGVDHLLFVLGLLLLARGRQPLLLTVTAFTAGHSVTLSLAVLGFVSLPSVLVEVAIAASLLVLAVELSRRAEPAGGRAPGSTSFFRRAPWALAFAFGLLHGLGFAGALAQIGLPAQEIPLALLSFNVGIELGQLAFVVAVLAAGRALVPLRRRAPAWGASAPAYAIGSLAAYWCFERASELF